MRATKRLRPNHSVALQVLFIVFLCALSPSVFLKYPGVQARGDYASEFGTYPGHTGPQYEGLTTQALHIPMRDGVRIAIDLMLPENLPADAKIPTIVKSTCYWRAIELRPPISWFEGPGKFEEFVTSNGYALIYVDARGTGASFGTRPHPWSPDEVMDGSDIVDWIIKQPWSNGRVGTIGTSYGGTAAEFFAVPNNPAVKAVIPRFADHDVYDDIAFPGGIPHEWILRNWALYTHHLAMNHIPKEAGLKARLFVRGVKPVDGDGGRKLLKEAVKEHAQNADLYELASATTYRDDVGNAAGATIDVFSPHNYRAEIERSKIPVYSWGSWLDASQGKAVIRRFMNYSNPQRAVIGPWSHGGGNHASPYLPADTPTDPSREDQWLDCLRFFDYYLKDIDNDIMKEKVLIYYTMGEEKWKSTPIWPPAGCTMHRLYMNEQNTLSPAPPASDSGSDSYAIDFEATTGTTNRWHTQIGGKDVIYPDRAEQDRRLLTYTSAPLTQDMEITGHPIVTLYLSSTHTDGAIFVYLEDVDEAGNVSYVIEGQLRALHRKVSDEPPPFDMPVPYHSFKKEDGMPLTPGETSEITFGLHPVSVLIKKGHRIRVAIAGHDKDTFARIPKEGIPTITIERNRNIASHIDLPVIAGGN
jgi:putative CocE/NonD family hydrolase